MWPQLGENLQPQVLWPKLCLCGWGLIGLQLLSSQYIWVYAHRYIEHNTVLSVGSRLLGKSGQLSFSVYPQGGPTYLINRPARELVAPSLCTHHDGHNGYFLKFDFNLGWLTCMLIQGHTGTNKASTCTEQETSVESRRSNFMIHDQPCTEVNRYKAVLREHAELLYKA